MDLKNNLKYVNQIKQMRYMDDTFFNECMNDNPDAMELICQIVLANPNIIIKDVLPQKIYKNLAGRKSIRLDAWAEDEVTKAQFDVEIQNVHEKLSPKRARYYSSIIDADSLTEGKDYTELSETYVIFITDQDVIGDGLGVYYIDRTINNDRHKAFHDEQHIVYVNGEYQGSDDVGKLVHDLKCTNPADMYYSVLAKRADYLKNNEKGVRHMCQIMENIVADKVREIVLSLNANHVNIDVIATSTGLTKDQVRQIIEENKNEKVEA